jgi:hypothetical protein
MSFVDAWLVLVLFMSLCIYETWQGVHHDDDEIVFMLDISNESI